MKIKERIKKWYRGKYIPPTPLECVLNENSVLPLLPHYDPPFLAKILNGIGKFWLKHWQWIISTFIVLILGLLTLYITYLKLIKTE